jgi:hypothetical protein
MTCTVEAAQEFEEEQAMKKYEKPVLEVVFFQEEEKLMVDDLTLEGIIGYSLRVNSVSL